jgi:phosphatidylserine decarboxylase
MLYPLGYTDQWNDPDQYDTDDTHAHSNLELTSMLDSLGATLTRSTLASFFTRYGKKPHEDEISIEQAIMCLEAELGRLDSEKKRLDADDAMPHSSVSATPVMFVAGQRREELLLDLDKLNFSGPSDVAMEMGRKIKVVVLPPAYVAEPMQMPWVVVAEGKTPVASSDDADNTLAGAIPVGMPCESTAESTNATKKAKDVSEDLNSSGNTSTSAITTASDSTPSNAS